MHLTPYREQARKVEVYTEFGITYYNIFVGSYRVVEYVSELWVNRLIDGYNLLQKQEVDEKNANRARIEYDTKAEDK